MKKECIFAAVIGFFAFALLLGSGVLPHRGTPAREVSAGENAGEDTSSSKSKSARAGSKAESTTEETTQKGKTSSGKKRNQSQATTELSVEPTTETRTKKKTKEKAISQETTSETVPEETTEIFPETTLEPLPEETTEDAVIETASEEETGDIVDMLPTIGKRREGSYRVILENSMGKIITSLSVRVDDADFGKNLMDDDAMFRVTERWVLYVKPKAATKKTDSKEEQEAPKPPVYDLQITFLDGTTTEIHTFPFGDADECELLMKDGIGYLKFPSLSLGSLQNTYQAELNRKQEKEAAEKAAQAAAEAAAAQWYWDDEEDYYDEDDYWDDDWDYTYDEDDYVEEYIPPRNGR